MITALVPVRGRIYCADIGYGDRPFLVVSNNRRNQSFESVLAVRITTSQKPAIPTVVRLAADDPVTGFALCDDPAPLYRDEIRSDAGAATPATMRRIAEGLRSALAL